MAVVVRGRGKVRRVCTYMHIYIYIYTQQYTHIYIYVLHGYIRVKYVYSQAFVGLLAVSVLFVASGQAAG